MRLGDQLHRAALLEQHDRHVRRGEARVARLDFRIGELTELCGGTEPQDGYTAAGSASCGRWGTIKGGTTYATPALSLLDLRRELPFPTKMIVVDMPGSVLRAAVAHSRKGEPDDERRAGG